MTIEDQANAINDAINQYLGTSGSSFVVSDMHHLWAKLFDRSTSLKALVMFVGEHVRQTIPGSAILSRVDREWSVTVSRGRSLTLDRGATLKDETVAGEPLFGWVAKIRDTIRGLELDPDTTERPIDYDGINQLPTEGTPLIIDAYQIRFTIGTQLPSFV